MNKASAKWALITKDRKARATRKAYEEMEACIQRAYIQSVMSNYGQAIIGQVPDVYRQTH